MCMLGTALACSGKTMHFSFMGWKSFGICANNLTDSSPRDAEHIPHTASKEPGETQASLKGQQYTEAHLF